ncbi:MAG: helix-turn-helix transcriptional regulator [Chloroflexi bacterium]|nr:helix-turn-helix transcriptional regulator [Chloroflexota bacterium]
MSDTVAPINPQALRAARKRRKLSQQQLADAIRCTKDTVSRWERGKSSRVRSHLREPLCKTLHVTWDQLTGPAEPAGGASAYLNPTIRVSIAEHARVSLQLAAARYGVRPQDVLDIAPLLFVIVAERSLLEREQRLRELRDAIAHTESELSGHFRHLGGFIAVRDADGEDLLWEEEDALANRDVFGNQFEEGPFIEFIRKLAKGLPKDAVGSIESTNGGSTIGRYIIADDILRDITGISGEDEESQRLLDHIRAGLINLAECVRAKRGSDEGQYRHWLIEELARADAESQRRWEEFCHGLGLSPDAINDVLERGSAQ